MVAGEHPKSAFLGSSEAAAMVRRAIERAALFDAPVLIVGESGVGKELVARGVHLRSRRVSGPFVPVNCAAIPDTLVESELFGHTPGAFTDARNGRKGAFELADRGSLFLDEIGDLSLAAQPKLLRALETGQIVPVGSERAHATDFRLIAATNHNLRRMARAGRFRDDLYYRLRVIEISVPPLRDRIDDVPELAEHFATSIAMGNGTEFRGFTREALDRLRDYHWPGNVRELRSVVERALVQHSGGVIDASSILLEPPSGSFVPLRSLLGDEWRASRHRFETIYVSDLLARHAGNVEEAARAAGLAPRSLYKMLRRLGLRPGSFSVRRGEGDKR